MSSPSTIQAGYKARPISITALTNMHVGSGKNNYGIIDNLVQKDVLTGIPTINSSSLKGALREFCHATWGKENSEKIRHIFGADTKEDEKSQGGAYIFMAAQLLSIPVRSDVRPFFRATCPSIIEDFQEMLSPFGAKIQGESALSDFAKSLQEQDAVHFMASQTGAVTLEDLELNATGSAFGELAKLTPLFGEHLVLVKNEHFRDLVRDENLPLIARNNLENGISRNLWYEQILPRQTRFATIILHPLNDPYQEEFFRHLQSHPVQIGANASIGYGFCELKPIN